MGLDDMMADYAAAYGGFPAPEAPWRLFQAAVARTPRYEARQQLAMTQAVSSAIQGAFSDKGASQARREMRRLVQRAYPVKQRTPEFHENLFATDQEPADA